VSDDAGYAIRGRLVLCEKHVTDERDEVAVFVDLQDASELFGNSMRVFCEMAKS
jgi:hypothetical protein